MKSSEKQSPSKASFRPCHLIALILGQSSVEGVKVTKNIKEMKFEEVWGEIESKRAFQRQWLTGYLGLTPVLVWDCARRGGGWGHWFSASVRGAFILEGGLGAGLPFYAV